MPYVSVGFSPSYSNTLASALSGVLLQTELGGNAGEVNTFTYAGTGTSTYSFGVLQFDVGNNDAASSFLSQIGFTQAQIDELSQQGGLSASQLAPLNALLSQHQNELAEFTNEQLQKSVGNLQDLLNNLGSGSLSDDDAATIVSQSVADQIYQSPELQLRILDYFNQFGYTPDGPLANYLAGNSVDLTGGNFQISSGDVLSGDDISDFVINTKYSDANLGSENGRLDRLDGALSSLLPSLTSEISVGNEYDQSLLNPGDISQQAGVPSLDVSGVSALLDPDINVGLFGDRNSINLNSDDSVVVFGDDNSAEFGSQNSSGQINFGNLLDPSKLETDVLGDTSLSGLNLGTGGSAFSSSSSNGVEETSWAGPNGAGGGGTFNLNGSYSDSTTSDGVTTGSFFDSSTGNFSLTKTDPAGQDTSSMFGFLDGGSIQTSTNANSSETDYYNFNGFTGTQTSFNNGFSSVQATLADGAQVDTVSNIDPSSTTTTNYADGVSVQQQAADGNYKTVTSRSGEALPPGFVPSTTTQNADGSSTYTSTPWTGESLTNTINIDGSYTEHEHYADSSGDQIDLSVTVNANGSTSSIFQKTMANGQVVDATETTSVDGTLIETFQQSGGTEAGISGTYEVFGNGSWTLSGTSNGNDFSGSGDEIGQPGTDIQSLAPGASSVEISAGLNFALPVQLNVNYDANGNDIGHSFSVDNSGDLANALSLDFVGVVPTAGTGGAFVASSSNMFNATSDQAISSTATLLTHVSDTQILNPVSGQSSDQVTTTTYSNQTELATGANWTDSVGDSGADIYNASGVRTSAFSQYANGTFESDKYDSITGDLVSRTVRTPDVNGDGGYSSTVIASNGDQTISNYDSNGKLLTTASSVASTGATTVTSYNSDGSVASSVVYSNGDQQTDSTTANGTHVITQYGPTNLPVSDTFTTKDGTTGTDTYNSDGSSVDVQTNSQGVTTRTIRNGIGIPVGAAWGDSRAGKFFACCKNMALVRGPCFFSCLTDAGGVRSLVAEKKGGLVCAGALTLSPASSTIALPE